MNQGNTPSGRSIGFHEAGREVVLRREGAFGDKVTRFWYGSWLAGPRVQNCAPAKWEIWGRSVRKF